MSKPTGHGGWRGLGFGVGVGVCVGAALALGAGTGCAVIQAEPHKAPPLELSAVNVNVNLNVKNSDSADELSWFSDPKLASGLMALAMVECEDSAGRGLGVADWGLVLVNSSIAMNRALAAETAKPTPEPTSTLADAEPAVKVVARGSRSPGAPDPDAIADGIGKASPFLTSVLVLHERNPAAARDLARECLSTARGLLLYQQATGEWPLDQAALDVWLAAQDPAVANPATDTATGERVASPYAASWERGRGDRLQVRLSTGYASAGMPQGARPEYAFMLRPLCLQAFLQRSLDRNVALRDLSVADAPAAHLGRSVWTALLLQSLVGTDNPAQPATAAVPPTAPSARKR